MIEETIKTTLHSCDICKRRISRPIIKCLCCEKEICSYCRIGLSNWYRKDPRSGYSITSKIVGNICFKCAEKKLKLKLSKVDY